MKPLDRLRHALALAESGNIAGALAALRQEIEAGHPQIAPAAAFNLGVLLRQGGDLDGAVAAMERAIELGDRLAYLNLAQLLDQRGDLVRARLAYEDAVANCPSNWAPVAAMHLGMLLDRMNEMAGALDAYQRAIESGHADATPGAALGLGNLLAKRNDTRGALAAFQQAIDSRHPEEAPKAAYGQRQPHLLRQVEQVGCAVLRRDAQGRYGCHGGPLPVELLGGCPTPTTRQASGGGPPLKSYKIWDNLTALAVLRQLHEGQPWLPAAGIC